MFSNDFEHLNDKSCLIFFFYATAYSQYDMTVEYTHKVMTTGFSNFARLLIQWKGGIYKLVLLDLTVYMLLYATISISYRFVIVDLSLTSKETFEKFVKYCADYAGVIPVSFVLGFYVSQIVTRWWSQFMTIPFPDTLAIVVATHIHGHDDRGRLMRRTLLRYANCTFVMSMCMMSSAARRRFPTIDHIVEAGFMLPHEKEIIEALIEKCEGPKYWVPTIWAGSIATRAFKEGRITDGFSLNLIIQLLCKFKGGCGDLLSYDWVCIPLVYTEVTTLAVYFYFLASLFGKQIIHTEKELDLFVPVFLLLEYFFYMSWLKVAESLVNPFGEDDDDFEVNWLIDRNFVVSYMIVDEMHSEHPELVKDQYWDEVIPESLPYTEAAQKFKIESPQGSAAECEVEDQDFIRTDDGRKSTLIRSRIFSKNQIDNFEMEIEPPDNDQWPKSDQGGQKVKSYEHLMEHNVIPKINKVYPAPDVED